MAQQMKTEQYEAPRVKAGPMHHKIVLVYDPARQIMIALDNNNVLPNNRINLKKGDTIEFSSPQGPVQVGFDDSTGVQQKELAAHDPAATVAQAPEKGARIWCGIKLNGATYGYPDQKLSQYGIQPEVP